VINRVVERIYKSPFARNVATLSVGHVVATAIPILAAPVSGRLYTPEDYGYFGQYMSVAMVLGVLSAGQYPQAIVIEKRQGNAHALVAVAVAVTFAVSVLTAIGAGVIAGWFGASNALGPYHAWIWSLPIATFGTGVASALSAAANREVRYRELALGQIGAAACSVVASIVLGYQGAGSHGLFIAFFASQAVSVAWLLALFGRRAFQPITLRRMRHVAALHWKMPLFTLPGQFVNTFTGYVPIYALIGLGDTGAIGNFNRAMQLLAMPLAFVGQAVSQVFRQRAAADIDDCGTCWPLFKKTAFALVAVSVVPTILLAYSAPAVFGAVLGPRWYGAGDVARILLPMLMLRTIASPLSAVFILFGRQQQDLWIMVLSCVVTIAIVSAAYVFTGRSSAVIGAYCLGQSAMYAIYLVRSILIARSRVPP
jgi:O-antigen/teichoic acid export membrane protein